MHRVKTQNLLLPIIETYNNTKKYKIKKYNSQKSIRTQIISWFTTIVVMWMFMLCIIIVRLIYVPIWCTIRVAKMIKYLLVNIKTVLSIIAIIFIMLLLIASCASIVPSNSQSKYNHNDKHGNGNGMFIQYLRMIYYILVSTFLKMMEIFYTLLVYLGIFDHRDFHRQGQYHDQLFPNRPTTGDHILTSVY